MTKWVRAKAEREPGTKVRIVLLVDPNDPENEQLMQFHDSLPYRSANQTYVQVLRDHAASELAGSSKSAPRQRHAPQAKASYEKRSVSVSTNQPGSATVSESRGVQQAPEPAQTVPAAIDDSATQAAHDKSDSVGNETASSGHEVSFSETAQSHFNMVD